MAKRLPATPDDMINDAPLTDVVETTNFSDVIPEDTLPANPALLSTQELERELAKRKSAEMEGKMESLKQYENNPTKYTEEYLKIQEQVQVMIPFDTGESVKRDRFGVLRRPVEKVGINGVTYEIPKGKTVLVPKDIAARIESSQNEPQESADQYDLALNDDKDIRKANQE